MNIKEVELDGLWQTSDDVPPEIIQAATKDCKKDDCILSARIGMTTCAGRSSYYTKQGEKAIWNKNSMTVSVCCGKCWKQWEVKTGEY